MPRPPSPLEAFLYSSIFFREWQLLVSILWIRSINTPEPRRAPHCVDPTTSGEKRKHTGCLETVGCLRHFSHRLVKIPGKSNVKKEGLFCLTGQGVTPYGREVMEVRTRSSWSHCTYSPEAERGERCWSIHSSFFIKSGNLH